MTAPQSPTSPRKFVRCPGCSERLGVRDEDAGRKARCTKCGRVFLVGGSPAGLEAPQEVAGAPAGPIAPMPVDESAPTLVTFECSLCRTRMTARVADVGRKVACPDCGRRTVIPLPPKPKAKSQPAALSGEQFDLWGVDDRPWEDEFKGPTLHPVECRLCQTLMYAADAQIGTELKCPDCGALTIAKLLPPPKPGAPMPVLAGEEYELDPESAPTARPVPTPIAMRDAELHQMARAATVGPDGKLVTPPQAPLPELRPERPAVPLVQGVWGMMFTQEIIARWVLLSMIFGASAGLFHAALASPNGGLAGFMGIGYMVAALVLFSLWLTMAAPLFLAIIAESSDGNDMLQEPPQWTAFDWFAESAYVINSGVMAGLMGLLAWRVTVGLDARIEVAAVVGAVLIFFPLLLLGAMLESSPFGVISPRLLSTLPRFPGPWLLFYIETGILAAAVGFGATMLVQANPTLVWLLPAIAMAAALVYMRLLGRLAWWLADVVPAPDEPVEVDR